MRRTLLSLFIISSISFASGEISFKKQREKEEREKLVQEKIDRNQENKEIKVIKRNNNSVRNKIIEEAKKKLGSPYLWGASGSDKFDCSSFVQYVYKKAANLSLPRVAAEQAQFKPKILTVKKGDLLFFETLEKGRISHVGIYIGGRQFIHASSAYKQVTVSEFSGFYKEHFRWAVSVL
jgi:NLP/P60 protein